MNLRKVRSEPWKSEPKKSRVVRLSAARLDFQPKKDMALADLCSSANPDIAGRHLASARHFSSRCTLVQFFGILTVLLRFRKPGRAGPAPQAGPAATASRWWLKAGPAISALQRSKRRSA